MTLANSYWIRCVVLCALVILRIASTPTANLSWLLLAGYATLGRAQAIQALALSWFFSMLNPGIAAEATLDALGRYAVIAGAMASVLLRSGLLEGRLSVRWPVAATLLLGSFLACHSVLVSPLADVSILKAVAWAVAMSTLIAAWQGLVDHERDRLSLQIFNGLVVILIISLPLLFHPLGYLRNGTGFQGVLGHPQAFGPTMAFLGAWAASQMFAHVRPAWTSVALVGASLVLVILSEARTAGVAMIMGLSVSFVTAPALSGQRILHVLPGLLSKRVWGVLAVAAFLAIPLSTHLADLANHYITKSGRADAAGLLEAYEGSRGRLVDTMWANIGENPLIGIGFGIASTPNEMEVVRDPLLGLPMGAAIEKGVMPLAVLEEVGLMGFLLVSLWLLMLTRRVGKGGVAPLTVTATALLMNLGEATFFSPGGMGMLSLVVVGWAVSAGQHTRPVCT